MQKNDVFIVQQPRIKPGLRLFCFPFAGGSAYSYQSWLPYFGPDVELVFVQLKGHGSRIGETPHQQMQDLVNELMLHSAYLTECPYMLFGHSLGALICYALACQLKAAHLPLPLHLFASGSRAPHKPHLLPFIHALPANEFLAALADLKGTPEEVLSNHELMSLFEPVLRSDFRIAETYRAQAVKMPFAISVLYGDKDHSISQAQLHAWQELTEQDGLSHAIAGDHFFVLQSTAQLMAVVQPVAQHHVLLQALAGVSAN